MSKRLIAIIAAISISFGAMVGCSKTTESENINNTTNANKTIVSLSEADTNILLGNEITVEGEGVTVENNTITINTAGIYAVSGTLSEGQLVVNAGDEDNVEIILNGVDVTNSKSAAINIINCKNAYLILQEGTENIVTDGSEYIFEDESTDEPNATIFSKADLFIDGTGSLVVNSNYNNGITSKDDLELNNGNITITSVADGLRGKDSITITNGNITIDAQGDGLKSNNDEDATKGYIIIENGTLNINSKEDAIQAETTATISGGEINITSGGGSANASTKAGNFGGDWGKQTKVVGEEASAKGIKANTSVVINEGNLIIDSADDSIHSNGTVEINGGTLNLASGDDAIHADVTLDINNGTINITKSYEGLESETININGGNINVVASDDGINAAGGNDGSAMIGFGGENPFAEGDGTININGGYLVIDADGDGIDSNGSIYMSSGTAIVNGPENSGNGALDYDGNFEVTGGLLIAAGSSGMAQSTSESSTQNTIGLYLDSTQEANTLISIKDESGNDIITFAPSKTYQSVIISSENIKSGSTYTAYVGGESDGVPTDCLYEGGTSSGGTEAGSVTVSSTVSTIGTSTGMGPQGGMMGPKRR